MEDGERAAIQGPNPTHPPTPTKPVTSISQERSEVKPEPKERSAICKPLQPGRSRAEAKQNSVSSW